MNDHCGTEPISHDLIESLPDALVVVGSGGDIFQVNSLAEAMFGYHRDEMVGRAVEMLMPECYRQMHYKERAGYFKAPRIRAMNECTGFYGLHSQGEQFAIEVYLSPLREGDNVWGLAAIRDISERKKMEDELRHIRDELEQRVAARTAELAHVSRLTVLGEMTSGMAHELSQPLAAISNFSQGCVRRMRNEKIDIQSLIPALERITAETSRAAEIITRFRQFARKEELQKQKITVADLVHKAVELERFEVDAHGLLIHVELQERLPEVLVDEIQIQQVIVNLVRNAIEATTAVVAAQWSIVVRVYSENSDEVTVAVEDSGPGFTEQQREQLFQPFFTTKTEGLGMGLAISRSIIEAHGGRLWAESKRQNGAIFAFTLPTNEVSIR